MTMDTSQHTNRFLPADIFTSGYRVVGKIMVSNTGTMGMLNDSTHSSMEVHDAAPGASAYAHQVGGSF